MYQLELCAGSVTDCLIAQEWGADRIELNSALALGGLTPTVACLRMARQEGVTLPIICMVRPRGGGFAYHDLDIRLMLAEGQALLEAGAQGLSFGCLTREGQVNWAGTQALIDLCHAYGAQAVFHRAIDVVTQPEGAIEWLIKAGCTRILTSGGATTAQAGQGRLADYQARYGQDIEFLMGSGVSVTNALALVEATGISQIHGSFKKWHRDPTTVGDAVSFAYTSVGDYESADPQQVQSIRQLLG